MAYERFIVKIEGKEITTLYSDQIQLEVELDDELASMCWLQITLLQTGNKWTYLDDAQWMIWNKISIKVGFDKERIEDLFSGYITHIRPHFEIDAAHCILEVWGMDGSVLMDREDILKAWPGKKDSDIAAEIFRKYGFTAHVENTKIVHDEKVSTIIQRETDIQFLKRLAIRNGFECFVEGKDGYFRKPKIDAQPQPPLAVQFGEQTQVKSLDIEVNALTAKQSIAMLQIDRSNKKILETKINRSQQKALGKTKANDLSSQIKPVGLTYISKSVCTGQPEMDTFCRELLHQTEWLVTAMGEIDGNQYAHVLKPRGTVTIKGISETHSGIYYVSHVTHTFNQEGYTQFFHAKRNGIHLTGTEKWE
jgi:phage protein D